MTKYAEMGTAIGKLTQEKNEAYGDSFQQAGKVLELLFPNGIKPEQYRDALGIVRVVDKLFRIATRKDAFGESPWKDIAGYGLLGAVADQGQKPVPEVLTKEAFKVGDTVNAEGWDGVKQSGHIECIDNLCIENLPYLVVFVDGRVRWFAAEELERV